MHSIWLQIPGQLKSRPDQRRSVVRKRLSSHRTRQQCCQFPGKRAGVPLRQCRPDPARRQEPPAPDTRRADNWRANCQRFGYCKSKTFRAEMARSVHPPRPGTPIFLRQPADQRSGHFVLPNPWSVRSARSPIGSGPARRKLPHRAVSSLAAGQCQIDALCPVQSSPGMPPRRPRGTVCQIRLSGIGSGGISTPFATT